MTDLDKNYPDKNYPDDQDKNFVERDTSRDGVAKNDPQKPADLRPMDDARLSLIARLSPQMAPIISALSYPDEQVPGEYPANSSAFETLAATHPNLAQAISVYIRDRVQHGESFDKRIEDASRALFGLPPMTDADERAWMHRHDVRPLPVAVNADHPVPAIAKQWTDPKNGPTIAEWVAAGYLARDYPPFGYDSRSTKEDIAAAVAAENELLPPREARDRFATFLDPSQRPAVLDPACADLTGEQQRMPDHNVQPAVEHPLT